MAQVCEEVAAQQLMQERGQAGGVGVNLQAADTVDLQAQARAHRIGQKRDVLVLRFETFSADMDFAMHVSFDRDSFRGVHSLICTVVQTVEEQVRASAEHKLGVANQSITAGFFDNNTSAEDRREYLEALLRECKKEEAAPVLDDDALNDVLARSETELDIFEAVDKKRKEDEQATWKKLVHGQTADGSDLIPPLPARLVTDEDLKQFYEAMKISDVPKGAVESSGVKRKGGYLGGLDTQQYGRGKRAREVRSYEEQWTEEEFEKMCQVEAPDSPKVKEGAEMSYPTNTSSSVVSTSNSQPMAVPPEAPTLPSVESLPVQQVKEITPPAKRGRGRPKRIASDKSPAVMGPPLTSGTAEVDTQLQKGIGFGHLAPPASDSVAHSAEVTSVNAPAQQSDTGVAPNAHPAIPVPTIPPNSQVAAIPVSVPIQARGQGRKSHGSEGIRRRGKKQAMIPPLIPGNSVGPDQKVNEKLENKMVSPSGQPISQSETAPSFAAVPYPPSASLNSGKDLLGAGTVLNSQAPPPLPSNTTLVQTAPTYPPEQMPSKGQNQKSQTGVSRRRGKKQAPVPDVLHQSANLPISSGSMLSEKATELQSLQANNVQELKCVVQDQASQNLVDQDLKSLQGSDDSAKQTVITSSCQDSMIKSPGQDPEVMDPDVHDASVKVVKSSEITSSKIDEVCNSGSEIPFVTTVPVTDVTKDQPSCGIMQNQIVETSKARPSLVDTPTGGETTDSISKSLDPVTSKIVPSTLSTIYPSPPASESTHPGPTESMPAKRQGRKIQNRAEPARRRGKKSASVLPVVPDAVTGQDSKSSHHAHNSSGDSLQGKATTNISQSQAFEILLPSGVVIHDSKRKDRATNSTHNKQQKVSRIDGAPISTDKISVHDVARVMKEVFSATCLPKPKAHDSAGSEDNNTTVVHVTTKAAVDASNNQILEDKARSDITTSGATCPPSDVVVIVHEKQSKVASKMQNLEGKANLDMPTAGEHSLSSDDKEKAEQTQHCVEISTTGCKIALDTNPNTAQKTDGSPQRVSTSDIDTCSLTSDVVVNVHEKQSKVASKMQSLEGKTNLDMPTADEHSLPSDVKEKAEQTHHCVESSTTGCKIALDTTLNTAQITDGSPVRLPTSDLNIDTCGHQMHTSSCAGSLVVINHKLGNQSDFSEECSRSSPLDICGAGYLPTPSELNTSSNNVSSQADMCTQSHSPTNEPPDITEQISTEKLDPSEPSLTSTSLACVDSSGSLVQTENLGDQPQMTSASPATDPSPRTLIVSSISEHTEVKNETECTTKASTELSSYERIVSCKILDSQLLEPENPITVGYDSQKALEPSIKQCSESASEMEDPVGLEAIQTQKHSDSVEPADLPGSPLIESCSKSLCEEKKDDANSMSEQHQSCVAKSINIDLVSQENIVLLNPIDNGEIYSSEACQMDMDTSDRLAMPQPSDLEAVGNDLIGSSAFGSLVEGAISEAAVLHQSTLVEEQTRSFAVTSLGTSSEPPLEESMEKVVRNNSGVQEGVKVDEVEPDVLMDSSISQAVLVKHDVFQENMNLSSHPISKEENIDGSTPRSVSISTSPSNELKDSNLELGDKYVSPVGDSQIGSEDNILKSLDLVSSPSVRKEEGISSTSDIDFSEGHSISLRVPVCSDDLLGKLKEHQLITVPNAVEPSSSQLKEEEKIGVSSDSTFVVRSISEKGMEGSGLLQEDPVVEINNVLSDSPMIVAHSVEAQVSLVKGDSSEIKITDQIDVSQASENDSERLTSKSLDDPSCLQTEKDANMLSDKDPFCSSLGPDEKDSAIENSRDGIMDPVANPLLHQKSECSESEKVDEMKTSDVGWVDPGPMAKNTDLPSSLVEQDKTDVSYESPLTAAEPNSSLTEDNCEVANEASNASEAKIGNQMGASDVAGVNTEQFSSSDIIEPSSSLIIEDNKIVLISDKIPQLSVPLLMETNDCLTAEGGCKDGSEGPSTNPVLLQELINNSEAEMCNQRNAQVGGIPGDDDIASEGKREVEMFSDEGPPGIFETQVESGGMADSEDRTDGKSCATDMENVSEVPNPSVSVEKMEGLSNEGIVGSEARIQVSEDCEVVMGDGVDVTPDCLDPSVSVGKDSEDGRDIKCCATEMENVSEVPNPSVSVEKMEGLSNEGIVGSQARAQVSEDSEAVMGDGIDVTPDCLDPSVSVEKDSEDRIDIKSFATEMENISEVSSPSVSVEKVKGLSNEGIVGCQSRMQVSENSEAVMEDGIDVTPDCLDPSSSVENVVGLSQEGLVCSRASGVVTGHGIDVTPDCLTVPETVSSGGASSPCSSAVGSEHVDNLSEKDVVGNSVAKLDTKESEAVVCNQENQVVQEKALEDMELGNLSEKDLDGNTEAKLDSEQSEAGVCNQENQEKAMKDIEKSTPAAEGSS
ncbi:unnamed protein product [Sphenostylis stenocarpa]|uniref:Snf2 ATP coupling domain-containing protein n=1 Tax=Sphenostylis stenocarpa TaxID=92480 RepID=A0AA86SEM4_9FABA|nr:unnamed protein product [Sphenostylis stenocarpa]